MGLSSAVARMNGQASADRRLAANEAFARAVSEPAYARLLTEFLRELSYHLVNLTIAVDPARIAIGGGMVHSWGVLEGPLRSALEAHVPYVPELVPGAFPYDAPLRGALEAVLELVGASGGVSVGPTAVRLHGDDGEGLLSNEVAVKQESRLV